jgi:hypothetical protein
VGCGRRTACQERPRAVRVRRCSTPGSGRPGRPRPARPGPPGRPGPGRRRGQGPGDPAAQHGVPGQRPVTVMAHRNHYRQSPFGLTNVASRRRPCQAISRSRRAATLLYEATRTTTRQPSCADAMPCYARLCSGCCGGDPSMACKRSGSPWGARQSASSRASCSLAKHHHAVGVGADYLRGHDKEAGSAMVPMDAAKSSHGRGHDRHAQTGLSRPISTGAGV